MSGDISEIGGKLVDSGVITTSSQPLADIGSATKNTTLSMSAMLQTTKNFTGAMSLTTRLGKNSPVFFNSDIAVNEKFSPNYTSTHISANIVRTFPISEKSEFLLKGGFTTAFDKLAKDVEYSTVDHNNPHGARLTMVQDKNLPATLTFDFGAKYVFREDFSLQSTVYLPFNMLGSNSPNYTTPATKINLIGTFPIPMEETKGLSGFAYISAALSDAKLGLGSVNLNSGPRSPIFGAGLKFTFGQNNTTCPGL